MSETKPAFEWKDARSHREPKWPFGAYAPGEYVNRCRRCDGRFTGMDKRALHCFPCAVDAAKEALEQQRAEIAQLKQENETLRAAIQIVRPCPESV